MNDPAARATGGLELEGRCVVVVSPHFDDVPLSLGQSLLDGALSQAGRVAVRVVFGRTNWSVAMHPTRRRAPVISAWRRAEEIAAALRFGYTMRALGLEEAILRTGSLDPDSFTSDSDLRADPLVERLVPVLAAWQRSGDVLLVPAGLGRHIDHRIVAQAGARLVRDGSGAVAFYEDRPYAAYLDDHEIAEQLGDLDLELDPLEVSGPISAGTHRWVRSIYRSQMDPYFLGAQERDHGGRTERLWVPRG